MTFLICPLQSSLELHVPLPPNSLIFLSTFFFNFILLHFFGLFLFMDHKNTPQQFLQGPQSHFPLLHCAQTPPQELKPYQDKKCNKAKNQKKKNH